VFLAGNFLLTFSDTFAVGCEAHPQKALKNESLNVCMWHTLTAVKRVENASGAVPIQITFSVNR